MSKKTLSEKVSDCCGYPLGVAGSAEGTYHYFCTNDECRNECNAVSHGSHNHEFKFINKPVGGQVTDINKMVEPSEKLAKWEDELVYLYEHRDIVGIAEMIDILLKEKERYERRRASRIVKQVCLDFKIKSLVLFANILNRINYND